MNAIPPTKLPRREEILDVATELFAERGFDGASMSDVADRVGMRKASLYYHFATKDVLYEAVIERLIVGLQAPLEAIYASDGTFEERLDLLTSTLVSTLGDRPHAARLLVREAMDWGPVMRGSLLDRVMFVLDASAAWIGAGQDAGVFVEGDPRHVVLTALGFHFMPFVLGKLVERYLGRSPFDPAFIAARRAELAIQTRALHVVAR
jgi:AcrR family transcriptional regulator